MIEAQAVILAGAAVSLVLALIEARAAELRVSRAGWIVTQAGHAALRRSRASHQRQRPARTLLILAARGLADALQDGWTVNAHAWAVRAGHLARTVQATDKRRRRYQRQHATPSRPELVRYNPEALPGVAS